MKRESLYALGVLHAHKHGQCFLDNVKPPVLNFYLQPWKVWSFILKKCYLGQVALLDVMERQSRILDFIWHGKYAKGLAFLPF